MVIYDFDFVDVFAFPTKAEAPLVVDANAVLTSYKLWKYNAVLSQRFVAVVRDFSAAAGASFHPADFPLPSVRPPCDSMSSGAFPSLLSMASGTTRVAFVIRRASSRASNCARTVSVLTLRCRCPKPVDSSANRCSLRAGSSSPATEHGHADERVISTPS